MPDLATGAVVFVTGGASGIGRAAAQQFSVEGAAHVVVADLDIDGAEDTVASLAGPGSSIELDVTDDTAVAGMKAIVRAAKEAALRGGGDREVELAVRRKRAKKFARVSFLAAGQCRSCARMRLFTSAHKA